MWDYLPLPKLIRCTTITGAMMTYAYLMIKLRESKQDSFTLCELEKYMKEGEEVIKKEIGVDFKVF